MCYWYPEGNLPTARDTECISLQKITSLLNIWASNLGTKGSAFWYQAGTAATSNDIECVSLQKINAILFSIAKVI